MDIKEILLFNNEIKNKFKTISVCISIIHDINNFNTQNNLFKLKNKIIKEINDSHNLDSLKDEPAIRAYRDFYWKLGIDPTKIRPAGEALVRRVLAKKQLPSISPAVDAYNLSSAETSIALSGYDLNKIKYPLEVRFASSKDLFWGIGKNSYENLKGNELIVADQKEVICIYPYRDSEISKIDKLTKNILILGYGVPELSSQKVYNAVEKANKYIINVCGGKIEYTKTF